MNRDEALAELRGFMVKIAGELLTVPLGDNRHTTRRDSLQAMKDAYEAIATKHKAPERESTGRHSCDFCRDCIHNGHKCCGCFDGVCCQESTDPRTQ